MKVVDLDSRFYRVYVLSDIQFYICVIIVDITNKMSTATTVTCAKTDCQGWSHDSANVTAILNLQLRQLSLTPVIATAHLVYTMPTCPLFCSTPSRLSAAAATSRMRRLRKRHASTSADSEFEPSEVDAISGASLYVHRVMGGWHRRSLWCCCCCCWCWCRRWFSVLR